MNTGDPEDIREAEELMQPYFPGWVVRISMWPTSALRTDWWIQFTFSRPGAPRLARTLRLREFYADVHGWIGGWQASLAEHSQQDDTLGLDRMRIE